MHKQLFEVSSVGMIFAGVENTMNNDDEVFFEMEVEYD
jgi:hypothetical protein